LSSASVVLSVLSEVLEDRVVVPVLSEDLFCHRLKNNQQKPMTKIGPHLRQEQQYDHLTPLANFKEQQKPMTK
jgi:hypothetical protein